MTQEYIIINVFATILLIYDAILMYLRIREGVKEIHKNNEQKQRH